MLSLALTSPHWAAGSHWPATGEPHKHTPIATSRPGEALPFEIEPAMKDRLWQSTEEANEEGLDVSHMEKHSSRLLRFCQAKTRELRPLRPGEFSLLEDGRVEISFHAPRPGVRRVTYFVDIEKGQARRIELRTGQEPMSTTIPFA